MAGDMNMVILVGHLGMDPQIHSFADGNRHAVLSLATSETWKDRATGERRTRTEWHRVVLKRAAAADYAGHYCCKGSLVRVVGQVRTRKYTQNGGEKYITEIVVAGPRCEFVLLGRGRPNMITGDAAAAGGHAPRPAARSPDPNAPIDYAGTPEYAGAKGS